MEADPFLTFNHDWIKNWYFISRSIKKSMSMKRLLILLGLGVFLISACNPDDEEQDKEPTIIGTWVDKESSGFRYNQTTMDTVFSYSFPLVGPNTRQFTFVSNGTLNVLDEGNAQTGSYVYANDQLTINVDGDVEVYDVPTLTASELLLVQSDTYTENGEVFYEEERVRMGK